MMQGVSGRQSGAGGKIVASQKSRPIYQNENMMSEMLHYGLTVRVPYSLGQNTVKP
jgi:hypothetical protein